MLTPETLDALDQALTAVIHEAGHDPQYAELVHALQAAQAALPADNDADDKPEHGSDAFAHAKAQMTAARSQGPAA